MVLSMEKIGSWKRRRPKSIPSKVSALSKGICAGGKRAGMVRTYGVGPFELALRPLSPALEQAARASAKRIKRGMVLFVVVVVGVIVIVVVWLETVERKGGSAVGL